MRPREREVKTICPDCNGSGRDEAFGCNTCDGTGEITLISPYYRSGYILSRYCDKCPHLSDDNEPCLEVPTGKLQPMKRIKPLCQRFGYSHRKPILKFDLYVIKEA